MIRIMNLNTTFLALTLFVAFGTYHVKYDAQRNAQTLKTLERQIEQEKERQRALMADWSVLNEPARLQKLAARHLALTPVSAQQIATEKELPERVPVLTASDPLDEQGGVGRVVTPAHLVGGARPLIISR